MGDAPISVPNYIDEVIVFPSGAAYERLQPLTTFRQCHDGVPAEARMVFTCRRRKDDGEANGPAPPSDVDDEEEFVIKIKVRVPGRLHDEESSGEQTPTEAGSGAQSEAEPEPDSSTTTRAELKALQRFHDANSVHAPRLVDYKHVLQGPDGPMPGGYMTYTVMTKMPGDSLHNLYFWGMPAEEREEVVREFLEALRSIYALGIEPVDCALRNVLWEREAKRCTIIDFELWRETDGPVEDETKELQRWGLARQPSAKSWWEAWNTQWR